MALCPPNQNLKPQKFGAVGAFLENFGQIFEKLWLKNAIKVNFLDFQKNFPDTPRETSTKRVFRGVEKKFFAKALDMLGFSKFCPPIIGNSGAILPPQ